MRPIPKIALIHDATWYKFLKNDSYGKPTFSASAPITFIRCEPIKEFGTKVLGEMKDDKLKLFYDCVNSEPSTLTFSKNDRIVFKSQNYTVRQIADFTPHHVELFLK